MSSASSNRPKVKFRALRRMIGDSAGVAALEFALVLLPFVMLLVGTMEIGRYYFTVQSLRTVVANAARMAMLDGDLASFVNIPAGVTPICNDSFTVSDTERDRVNANTPFLSNADLKICINNSTATGNVTVIVKASYPFSSVLPLLPVNMTITDQTTLAFKRY